MRAEDIEALAVRVEAATGADRELDEAIAEALGWSRIPNPTFAGGLVGRWAKPDGSWTGHNGPPQYTASIDAAMSLVPEGWRWTIFHEGVVSLKPDVAFCGHPKHRQNGIEKRADAATPALALTAAALRARAHSIRERG